MALGSVPFADVLRLLRAGALLYTREGEKKTFFALRNHQVIVRAENYSVKLSLEEWQNLYEHNLFYLFEDEGEDLIDPKKDEEYYSWRHK